MVSNQINITARLLVLFFTYSRKGVSPPPSPSPLQMIPLP